MPLFTSADADAIVAMVRQHHRELGHAVGSASAEKAGASEQLSPLRRDLLLLIEVANGVYTPAVIDVKRGEVVTLRFHRRDASPCAEQVVFHGLDISEALPLNGTRDIVLKAEHSGEFRFTCQMQMYQGLLRVRD